MGAFLSRIVGFFSSKQSSSSSSNAASNERNQEAPKVYSWDLRKNIDPKDYTIENKNGETVVKMPGSINGNQFIIKNLQNCSIYIFDYMAVLSIDDCKNCKFFFGPCKGSVFIRNSTDCALATICQQFRTRDCKNITTFIVCTSMPIIESSTMMKFACLTCNYNALNEQLKSSNLSVFNSNWSTIHDFTRVPGQSNYLTLDRTHKLENYVNYPEASIKNQLGVSFDVRDSIIPFSIGTAAKTTAESCLVIFFYDPTNPNSASQNARTFLKAVTMHPDVWLVNCKNYTLSELSSENVFGTKDYNKHLQRGPIIGLELNGNNCVSHSRTEAQNLRLNENHIYISTPSSMLQNQIDNFYNYSDMQMFG